MGCKEDPRDAGHTHHEYRPTEGAHGVGVQSFRFFPTKEALTQPPPSVGPGHRPITKSFPYVLFQAAGAIHKRAFQMQNSS